MIAIIIHITKYGIASKIANIIKGKANLEKALRHIEYLGVIGASRNIMIRVDGDGSGRINVYKNDKRIVELEKFV